MILLLTLSPPAAARGIDPPVLVGWGGIRLREVSAVDATNPPSVVFPGKQASNAELEAHLLSSKGYDAFRVDFESQCTTWKEAEEYNATNLANAFTIAQHFGLWIIVDYHGFNDTATPTTTKCWLGFWKTLVQQFSTRYGKTVWEPLNEPTGFGHDLPAVQYLSQMYQGWINQTRALGDPNWIVVQNLCSFRCNFADKSLGYPWVSDPRGKILISIHPYMSYKDHWRTWNNATADSEALALYTAMVEGQLRTGWSSLNTEGGPGGVFNGTQYCPDLVVKGSAGYCRTSFHFIQALTARLDGTSYRRINWIWWTIGSWTDTLGAGLYGALNTWGSILRFRTTLQGDVNGDCKVNIRDIVLVVSLFGRKVNDTGFNAWADEDNDGIIAFDDLVHVAASFGQTCPP